MPNLINEYKNISKKIDAYTTYLDSNNASKTARRQSEIFFDKVVSNVSNSININKAPSNLKTNKAPSVFEQIISYIKKIDGEGLDTNNKLLKTFSDITVKNLSEIKKILSDEAIKLLGCRDDQTFPVIPKNEYIKPSFKMDKKSKVFVPIKNLDLFGNLTKSPDSTSGIFFYENLKNTTIGQNITNDKYKGYGGNLGFSFNRELYERLSNEKETFYQKYGTNYKGYSGLDLFDFSYETKNDLDVDGDFIAVALLGDGDNTFNSYSKFIFDYYDTLDIIDFNNIIKNIFSYLIDGADITESSTETDIKEKSKFMLLIERFCNKCIDNSEEINVSGISKISELDNDTDDFFTFSEIDLRKIDRNINNYQNKIIDYESCGVLNQPIDYEIIRDFAKDIIDTFDGLSEQEKSNAINEGILSILQNNNLQNNNATLFSFVKATIESIISPKLLFPIMVLGQVIEGTINDKYNELKDQAEKNLNEAKSNLSYAKEVIGSAEIFAKKYKVYIQNVTKKILELFLKELFNILKGKLKKMVSKVVGGIFEKYTNKQKRIILALTSSLFGILSIKVDLKKCKSVIESIGQILNSINVLSKRAIIPIPAPLLLGAQFLPGYSSERAKINVISEMQNLGLKTENLLDGSPNRVLLFAESLINGMDSEEITNGAVDGFIDPLLTGRVFAKKRHG
jgi:hypothetical protein